MKRSQIKIVALIFFVLVIPFFFSNAEKGKGTLDQQLLKPIQNTQEFFHKHDGALLGTKTGLYQIVDGLPTSIWEGGEVLQIFHTDEWIILTSNGIFASSDLKTFEDRNNGLPFYKIKKIVVGTGCGVSLSDTYSPADEIFQGTIQRVPPGGWV